jgi:hypothetical protein
MKNPYLRRCRWVACVAAAVAPAFFGTVGAASADDLNLVAAISVGPDGISSFDISYVDPVIGNYFLSDRTNKTVDVIDTATRTVATQLGLGSFVGFTGDNDTSGPNGVFVVDHRYVWAGDGNSNIRVFDLQTQTQVANIMTGGTHRADEGCYDERDHLAMVANDAEGDASATPPPNLTVWPYVSVIDTRTFEIKYKIVMNGTGGFPGATNGIEQCKWSPRTGKFYLDIPEVNGTGVDLSPGTTLVIDPQSGKLEVPFVLHDHNKCAGPQGMALGPNGQVLLGCNAASGNGQFSTIVLDENKLVAGRPDDETVIATVPHESGSDEVWFNPGDGLYFLARSTNEANASDTATADSKLGVINSETLTREPSFTTGSVGFKAHSVAADPVLNQVFVPIPKNNTTATPPLTSTVCSQVGGSDTDGCIAVFTARGDDHQCFAQGAPVIQASEGGDPAFFKTSCH